MWPSFASDKFEKILGAGHAQQETYVVLVNSLVVCDPLIFSNLSDAKLGHQYVVLFFEQSYNEWTLEVKTVLSEKFYIFGYSI